MSTKSPKDDTREREDLAKVDVERAELLRDITPCTVYDDSPETMGRVTTPLGDLSFVNVFGGLVSMARQVGRRSAGDIREGALPFLGQFLPDVVEALVPRPMVGASSWLAQGWLIGRLRQAYPDEYLKALRAYGEGCGAEVEGVVTAQMAWDIWGVLARAPLKGVQRLVARSRVHSPLLGSASAVLPTENLGPLHLRWLDNTAVDRWDRKTSVTFFHPDRGLAYALVSSVGFLTGLAAGMNAAGLTLSVEPGGAGGVDMSGAPLGPAVHEILSNAHTIEEAAMVLRQRPSLCPWRYVVSEGDTGRAAVIHADLRGAEVEMMSASLLMASASDATTPGVKLERIARWHRSRRDALEYLISEWPSGGNDAVFDLLTAMNRPMKEQMVIPGHPLNGLSNVGAVVFEPAARRLWVAAGRAPTARRWFVPIALKTRDKKGNGGFDRRARPIKPGGAWESTEAGRAMENLRHAYQLDLADEPPERVLITLEYALALDSGRPALHILAGLMALRANRGRRAEGAFRKAINLIEEASHRAEVGLYLAWALDLQQRRKAARNLYARLNTDPTAESDIRRWARRGRRRRFRDSDGRNLTVDFMLATVLI